MSTKKTLRDEFAMAYSPNDAEVFGLWRVLDNRRGGTGDMSEAMQGELEFCRAVIKYIHADAMIKQREGNGLTDEDFNAISKQELNPSEQ